MRQEFATHMLNKLWFVYRHAKGNDPKVHIYLFYDGQDAKHDIYRNSVASFAICLLCRFLPLTSMLFQVQDGLMGSIKEIGHQSLIQYSPWQPLRYMFTCILVLLLIYT